jgi:hypothetical protein
MGKRCGRSDRRFGHLLGLLRRESGADSYEKGMKAFNGPLQSGSLSGPATRLGRVARVSGARPLGPYQEGEGGASGRGLATGTPPTARDSAEVRLGVS